VRLCAGSAREPTADGRSHCFGDEGIDLCLFSFGIRRFLADVDAGRDYRAAVGIVGAVLDFVAGEGFGETMSRHGLLKYDSAQAFRNRYITGALGGH
jgi:hypothetical protein